MYIYSIIQIIKSNPPNSDAIPVAQQIWNLFRQEARMGALERGEDEQWWLLSLIGYDIRGLLWGYFHLSGGKLVDNESFLLGGSSS